jgi:hypothetical protein
VCSGLAAITIPAGVTNIQADAFDLCGGLTAIYFQGNAPSLGANAFYGVNAAVAKVYYLAGTTGWTANFGTLPTVLLDSPPRITGGAFENAEFTFIINGVANQVVVVEACTNLAGPAWQPLQTNTLAGAPSASTASANPEPRENAENAEGAIQN